MQQNFVPVVQKVLLHNVTSEDLHDVTVTIKADSKLMGKEKFPNNYS